MSGAPVRQAGGRRAVHEVGGALRQQRGEVVHLLGPRLGRKAPVHERAAVGQQVSEARAGALRRRRGDHVDIDDERDRQAAVPTVKRAVGTPDHAHRRGDAVCGELCRDDDQGQIGARAGGLGDVDRLAAPDRDDHVRRSDARPCDAVHLRLGVGLDADGLRGHGRQRRRKVGPQGRRVRRPADHAHRFEPELRGHLAEQPYQLSAPVHGAQVMRQLHVAALPAAHATRASTSSRACARSSWSSISTQASPSTATVCTGT